MCLHPNELQAVLTPNETNISNESSSYFCVWEKKKNVLWRSYSMLGLGLHRASRQVTESSHSLFSTCTLASQMASAHNKATPSTE